MPSQVLVARQGPVELRSRSDAELGEYLAQVVLHCPDTDEQPLSDLRIGQAVPSQPRDLILLAGQSGATGDQDGPCRHRAAGGPQLTASPLSERRHAHFVKHLAGGAQLLARIGGAALTTEPFTVEQMGASQVRASTSTPEPLDGLTMETLGFRALAEQRV
jgi:hypothetical protein